jgi:hypothetical protein
MGLTEVSLPDNGSASKISIGDNAFDDCFNLEYFSLPNANISIGTDVFDDCVNLKALKSTTDLTKIISIGNAAFEKCSSLTIDGIRKLENKIDTNNLKYVGDENGAAIVAALDKTWLNRAGIVSGDLTNLFVEKGYFNGSMVTGAFANCDSLTGIDLQDANLPTLGTGAFDDATVLNSVKLPNNTTSIPMATFAHCSGLTNLY